MRSLMVLSLTWGLTLPHLAQAGWIKANFDDVSPGLNVNYKLGASTGSTKAGVMNWDVVAYDGSKGGAADAPFYATYPIGSSFTSFCVELSQYTASPVYFERVDVASVPRPGSGSGNPSTGMGDPKADALINLFAKYYDPTAFALDSKNAVAFQIAIWEIVHESLGAWDTTAGNFYITNTTGAVDLARDRANLWLQDIASNTYAWSSNSYLAGKELYGLTSATHQDQITLVATPVPGGVILGGVGVSLLSLYAARRRKLQSLAQKNLKTIETLS